MRRLIRGAACLLLLMSGLVTLGVSTAPVALAYTGPKATHSHYEHNATASTFAAQGQNDGYSADNGVGILDFGRPAQNGSTYGTIEVGGGFVSMAQILSLSETYADNYYFYGPASAYLNIAIGVNNSCTTNQPCGNIAHCGCSLEPTNFTTWGTQWRNTVQSFKNWISSTNRSGGISAVAANDAEPAWDPGYSNTINALKGYTGTAAPAPMYDYGSQESGFWTNEQLYQVAWGLGLDYPFGEIYVSGQATGWENLDLYAVSAHGSSFLFTGVLTQYTTGCSGCGYTPAQAYNAMMTALNGHSSTAQSNISYASNI